jgi:hypothetical protein
MRIVVENWTPGRLMDAWHGGVRAVRARHGTSVEIALQEAGGGWRIGGDGAVNAWDACYFLNLHECSAEYEQ